jgi:hypothetical protein
MAASKKSKQGRSGGTQKSGASAKAAIIHHELTFDPGTTLETSFERADLVFEGVDHAQGSYEVRVFLNNKKADDKTARTPRTGYAGRFVVFGHGRCFGTRVAPPPRGDRRHAGFRRGTRNAGRPRGDDRGPIR